MHTVTNERMILNRNWRKHEFIDRNVKYKMWEISNKFKTWHYDRTTTDSFGSKKQKQILVVNFFGFVLFCLFLFIEIEINGAF